MRQSIFISDESVSVLVSVSVSVLVFYSVTASPAQTVGAIVIGNQAINLYGGPEAGVEPEYIICTWHIISNRSQKLL